MTIHCLIIIRFERVRRYLKQGLSAIEALRKGYEDVYHTSV
jgi:hypothetical protein